MKSQKHTTVNYRNGIYQGPFSSRFNCRSGFGLVYNLNNHSIIASQWKQDEATGPTLILYNQNHYMYGNWENNLPSGLNVVKIDSCLLFINYENGRISGNLLAIFQKYNLAIVLTTINRNYETQFQVLEKGQIFCDSDFQRYVQLCRWDNFDKSYKTMIKFITQHLTFQGNQNIRKIKLRLVNESFYRYGFDEGIAIIFDDEYKIKSVGLHKKATLKSLGIKFTREKFAEEGDFGQAAEVYAFQLKQRPENKIGKLYSGYLLKSTQFVNKFLGDPSKPFFEYFRSLMKQNLFKHVLSGQITNRKLQLSPSTSRKQQVSFENEQEPQVFQSFNQNLSPKVMTNQFKDQDQDEDDEEVKKMKLQILKKEIYESISRKKFQKNQQEKSPQNQRTERKQIINKSPVGKIAKVKDRKQKQILSQSRKREPIFTPQTKKIAAEFSPSPQKYSPFKEKMRSKIFDKGQNYHSHESKKSFDTKKSKKNQYVYNEKQYQSPHEALQYSVQENEHSLKHIPLSIKQSQKLRSSKKIEKHQIDSLEKKKYYESPKRVSFAENLQQTRKQKSKSPYLQNSQKNKVYLHGGQVNYEPIKEGQVKKNSYYEKFQKRKSQSRSPHKQSEEVKKSDKYTEIVKKFNESKNRPFQKRYGKNAQKEVSPYKKKYEYYFP